MCRCVIMCVCLNEQVCMGVSVSLMCIYWNCHCHQWGIHFGQRLFVWNGPHIWTHTTMKDMCVHKHMLFCTNVYVNTIDKHKRKPKKNPNVLYINYNTTHIWVWLNEQRHGRNKEVQKIWVEKVDHVESHTETIWRPLRLLIKEQKVFS